MLLNLLVLIVVLGMGYWWGMVQGLFSSFLNLICITIAGCIALAFWEPLAGLLIEYQPLFAWGIGLLLPFALALAVLRVAMDTLVPGNVQYNTLLNPIAGGLIGIFSGMILTGLLIIGMSFMTVPSLAGYQAYAVNDDGKIIRNDRLWIPVDNIASLYFQALAGRAFSTGEESLNQLIPDLARHAGVFHFRVDRNSSNVASPKAFNIGSQPIKLPLKSIKGLEFRIASKLYSQGMIDNNSELMVINTVWDQHFTAVDNDLRIRLTPAHVRLLGRNEHDQAQELQAVAWAIKDKQTDKLEITHNKQASLQIIFNDNQYNIKWMFVLPPKFRPTHFICRNNRKSLADYKFNDDSFAVARLLGSATQVALRDESPILGRVGEVHYNPLLPAAISRSYATGVDFENGELKSGNSTIRQGDQFVRGDTRVESVFVPDHQYCVRVKFTTSDLYHLFARHQSSPKRKRQISVINSEQVKLNFIGYIRVTDRNTQQVTIRRKIRDILTGEDLPIDELEIRDSVHLYFVAPESNTAMWLKVGDNAQLLRYNQNKLQANADMRGAVDKKRLGIITAMRKPALSGRLPAEASIIKGEYTGTADTYGLTKTTLRIASEKLLDNNADGDGPKIWVEPQTSLVQVKLKGIQVFALLGEKLLNGNLKGNIIIEDQSGNAFKPIGSLLFNRLGAHLDLRGKPEYKVYDLNIDELSDLDELTILFNMPTDKKPVKLIYREIDKEDIEYLF